MTRKRISPSVHPDIGNERVGLMVVDVQTLHKGHVFAMMRMRMTCSTGIVGVGSVSLSGVEGHPFTFKQRVEMVQGVFGDAFKFVELNDIDATTDKRDWYAYVSDKVRSKALPEATDYFCGSVGDASWYTHAFADPAVHPSSGHGPVTTWENPVTGRRLHVVDRKFQDMPSGRDIRLMIEFRDPAWKLHVPEILHRYVEANYPPHLRQPIPFSGILSALEGVDVHPEVAALLAGAPSVADLMTAPAPENFLPATRAQGNCFDYVMAAAAAGGVAFPVGTRLSDPSHEVVLELKDDGKWRPLRGVDEKTAYALQARSARQAG